MFAIPYIDADTAAIVESTGGEARVLQGIISGIELIGRGAILNDQVRVAGVVSAASIRNAGAVGVALAFYLFEIATLLNAVKMFVFRKVKISPV